MPLSAARITWLGKTDYAHEREGLEHVFHSLPDCDPHHAWALGELVDPSTGRLYEIDALVLGRQALYLLELKAYDGVLEGDGVDWMLTSPGGGRRRFDNPRISANLKARVLASRLDRLFASRQDRGARRPRVEALVVLTKPGLSIRLTDDGRKGVVARTEVTRALVHGDYPGNQFSGEGFHGATARQEIRRAFETIGLRPRHHQRMAGAYVLKELLADGPGYQDRLAEHKEQPALRRRARTYLVPEQTTVERRQLLKRAADREARLLEGLRDHRGILACLDYVSDAEPGPTVLFDAFDGAKRLDDYVASHPELDLGARVDLIAQVGRALAHCHEKSLHHGAISPEAVLVRDLPGGGRETRLFNFQLGAGVDAEGTVHRSSLSAEPFAIYQAPELRLGRGLPTEASDLFSLGALAYFVLTGAPPGGSVTEVDTRLEREGHLDPDAARDDLLTGVAELVRQVTAPSLRNRFNDSVTDWTDLLEAEATAPEEPAVALVPEIDPLRAKPEQILGSGAKALVVTGRLGHGASSVVLAVEREGRPFALKVSDATEHDARLEAEGAVLERLSHPRIVSLIERVDLAGRPCLLLSHAGDKTLHAELRDTGIVSLEFAQRWGDDLLKALGYLADNDLLHRDIKPSNLVLGAGAGGKSARRLTLIDFSLEGASMTDLALGTAAYRDPFLPLRGRWDVHADLWSAAITLHEMLTGTRPVCADPSDLETPLAVPAERFDASARTALSRFFARALAPRVEARFPDAAAMQAAFRRCFEAEDAAPTRGRTSTTAAGSGITNDELARVEPGTALEALPLSSRAKNALDRAGFVRVDDLLRLPDNRLSAMRGVGKQVADEILDLRDRWRALRPTTADTEASFYAGYRGEDLLLAHVGAADMPAEAMALLADAGLPTLAALAAAPEANVATLAARVGVDRSALRALLDREQGVASEREHPTTLEAWHDAIFPAHRKRLAHVRLAYGLEAPFLGRLDVTVKDVATHAGVTTAAVYINLGKARELWRSLPALTDLHELAARGFGPNVLAMPLDRFADALVAALPHAAQETPEQAATQRAVAAGLARVLVESASSERAAPFALARLRADGAPWLVASPAITEPLRRLGEEADRLAKREVLPSPGEVARTLAESATSTPLAELPADRLVQLAALASSGAACSGRLELYPRGLSAHRTIELCAGILQGSPLTPAEVRRRVAARYPEAEPPPEPPALDALLAPLGYAWSAAQRGYERPGDGQGTSLQTSFAGTRTQPGAASAVRGVSTATLDRAELDHTLAVARERGGFRALYVNAAHARRAAVALGRALGRPVRALDRELLAAMDEAAAGNVDRARIDAAETEGPRGPAWVALANLARAGAERLLARLLPPAGGPLVLVQPGLFVRYDLRDALARLVGHAAVPGSPILLLVPAHDVGGAPPINGALALQGLLPNASAWVPRAWIDGQLEVGTAQTAPA